MTKYWYLEIRLHKRRPHGDVQEAEHVCWEISRHANMFFYVFKHKVSARPQQNNILIYPRMSFICVGRRSQHVVMSEDDALN